MKILITGGKGFIAQGIANYLNYKYDYDISVWGRDTLNLMSKEAANEIKINNFNAVVHCAFEGGTFKKNSWESFYRNLYMFENLESALSEDTKLINIASGAEFNKLSDIKSADYCNLSDDPVPDDFYGLAKNIIAKRVVKRKNSYNLRLFGCFGPGEEEERFITKCFTSKKITIKKDMQFDYFYIDDLARVVSFLVEGGIQPRTERDSHRDINCVYNKKMSLYEIAMHIKNKYNNDLEVDSIGEELGYYTGCHVDMQKISVFMKDKIRGFENGLDNYYETGQLSN